MTDGEVIVEARALTKRFPGVLALDRVDFRIVAGQVNALVGENGAGKSTLMNILSGVYTDYEGEVLVDGRPCRFAGVGEARRAGVAIIHQELSFVPYMNIAENMFLGREPLTPLGLTDQARMHAEAREWLLRLHLEVDTHTLMDDLRIGQQQLVEIAKALSLGARVLIMDEPTSSLSTSETEILFDMIAELKQKGVGIVYISHKMDEVWRLADFVTVMRDGQLVTERPMSELTPDEVVQLMVGREQRTDLDYQENVPGRLALEVEHLVLRSAGHADRKILDDISFSLHSGEVLGFYGLMGAGRTELLETIFGLHPAQTTGNIRVEGRPVQIRHPQEAVCHGLALCPEDRKREGLVLGMSIKENVTLASLNEVLRHGLLSDKLELGAADDCRGRLGIKSTDASQLAGQLSGGNQQKIVIGKWLKTKPRVLFLDEPTRGIDIHAKTEICRLVRGLASEGMAIVFVSSELPEIMAVCDRIITLREGRLAQEFKRGDFTEEAIIKSVMSV